MTETTLQEDLDFLSDSDGGRRARTDEGAEPAFCEKKADAFEAVARRFREPGDVESADLAAHAARQARSSS